MEPETSPVDAPPAENQSEDGGNLEIAESGSEKERSVTPEEELVPVGDVQVVEEVQEVAEQENNDGEPMDLEEDDEEEGIEAGNGENVEEEGQEEGEEGEEEDDEDDDEEEEDVVHDEESIAKSKIQKDSFLEMFRIAPRVRDVLPDLRTFINHPDVIKQDKMEIQQLVELKIQEEKAKKKAEKEKEKEKEKEQAEAAEKPPIDLAQAIRNVTGLDLAGILNKASQRQAAAAAVPVSVPPALPPTINLVPPALPVQIVPAVPPELANAPTLTLGTSAITAIRVGKAGFSTPHPAETAAAIQAMRPEVAPIPEELIQNHKKSEVPPIPNELLPLDQRVPVAPDPVAEPVYSLARPPIRKTLLMAGARPGKRVERRKALAAEEDKSKRASSRKSTSSRSDRDRERDRERDRNRERERERDRNRPSFDRKPERRTGRAGFGGSNALPSDLNMNTPLPVKRYHARQLAKDTGITFEKAMEEIEEQCAQFHRDDQEAHDANAAAMETLMRRGDRNFNQRNNYVPADHSAGIPGVDRPPGGARMGRSPDRDVGRRDGGIPGVDRPPGGGRMDRDQDFGRRDLGIPGVDRPPGGGRRDAGLPNRERGPYGQGTRPRKRGGVKEREKQRRREEMRRSGGNYGGGEWDRDRDRDRDRWADNGRGPGGPPNKQGRYDVDQPPQSYADFANSYQQESGAYEGTQDYQGYYEGQEGYQQYDQTGSEGYANYEYYQGQEGQQEDYYQEDGSQYYNEYYGTSDAPQEGYQATFAAPGETRPAE